MDDEYNATVEDRPEPPVYPTKKTLWADCFDYDSDAITL